MISIASRRLQSVVVSTQPASAVHALRWPSSASRGVRYNGSQAAATDRDTKEGHRISDKRLRQFLQAEVTHFQFQPTTGIIGLEELLEASTPRRAVRNVNKEIPRRFARRIRQIEEITGWHRVPELKDCHARYTESFRSLRMADVSFLNYSSMGSLGSLSSLGSLGSMGSLGLPGMGSMGGLSSKLYSSGNQTHDIPATYTEIVRELKERQGKVLPLIGAAMHKLNELDSEKFNADFWNGWLDRFLRSRICTEMLTSQYLTVWDQALRGDVNIVGIVDPLCDPKAVCSMAAQNASRLCRGLLGLRPIINIESRVNAELKESHKISYIPNYLHYIVLELLKNSCKATAGAAQTQEGMAARPINVVICADKHRVAIRISDLGGGIPFDVGDHVWDFLYSSRGAEQSPTELAGYGIGLPLARLYAEYLGGSLSLMSMPDYGVTAYLFLKRIDAKPGDMSDMSDMQE